MVKKIVPVVLVAVIALAGWFAYYYSDKVVIRRQLAGLAGELGKEAGETPIKMALKMRAVKDQLADSCQVLVPELDFAEDLEQDLIIQYLMYRRNSYDVITVVFEDLQVDILVKDEAAVQLSVQMNMFKENPSETVEESGQVELMLKKGEENWLLHKVVVPENLVE